MTFGFRRRRSVDPSSRLVDLAFGVAAGLRLAGCAADFTLESLHDLDRLIDQRFVGRESAGENGANGDVASLVVPFGAYVGQCLIKHFGGRWELDRVTADPDDSIVVLSTGYIARPIDLMRKRFCNGKSAGALAYAALFAPPEPA
jgi:hypothetical protein